MRIIEKFSYGLFDIIKYAIFLFLFFLFVDQLANLTETNSSNQFICSIVGINPWFQTGYADGDGTFHYTVSSSSSHKLGFKVSFTFTITAVDNKTNKTLLQTFTDKFGGKISINPRDNLEWRVRKREDQIKLRTHFDKYPLQTSKYLHFQTWATVFDMVQSNDHFTLAGLEKIISLKGAFPKGLSAKLSKVFSHVIPIDKPIFIPSTEPLNGHWIAGFVTADGNFTQGFSKSSNLRQGYRVNPRFTITQHNKDIQIQERIKENLNIGTIHKAKTDCSDFVVSNNDVLFEVIIPFFNNYPLYGTKREDFFDFKKGKLAMRAGRHLTPEGLAEIKNIYDVLNSGRKL